MRAFLERGLNVAEPAGSLKGWHMDEERKKAREQRGSGPLRVIWDWTRSLFFALMLFLVVRTFVVEAFKIPTSSMEGTLLVGDFLLVNKAAYGSEVPFLGMKLPALKEPLRGDIVVFNPPHDPLKNYVKRVVGVPGDTLEMRDKTLFLNGVEVSEKFARYVDRSGADAIHPNMKWQSNHLLARETGRRQGRGREYLPSRDNWGPLAIPESSYFVLGDNRDNSEDSRYWGFVNREAIRGQPWIVYFSFDATSGQNPPWLRVVRWDRVGDRIH